VPGGAGVGGQLGALPGHVVAPAAERLAAFALPGHVVDVGLEVFGDLVDLAGRLEQRRALPHQGGRIGAGDHLVQPAVRLAVELGLTAAALGHASSLRYNWPSSAELSVPTLRSVLRARSVVGSRYSSCVRCWMARMRRWASSSIPE